MTNESSINGAHLDRGKQNDDRPYIGLKRAGRITGSRIRACI